MRALFLAVWMISAAWAGLENYQPQSFSEELLIKAESGDAEAQCQLAGAYQEGRGTAKNRAEAKKWLERSADAGFPIGQMALAGMYLQGDESERNLLVAEKLLLSAEEKLAKVPGASLAKAKYFLGMVYLMPGSLHSLDKARMLLQTAGDLGDSCAQHALGDLYAQGQGIEKNEALALEYLQKSAATGKACGQISLAEFYLRRGDYESAREWLEEASEQGGPQVRYKLGRVEALTREDVAAEQTFRQLASEELQKDNPDANFWIAVAAIEAGQFEKAKEALQNAGSMNTFGARSFQASGLRRSDREDPLHRFSVEILGENWETIGSGVWAGEGGKVLTAAHVVAEKKKILVRDSDFQMHEVSGVWAGRPDQDLAVLQTSRRSPAGAAWAPHAPAPGDPLTVLGHPASSLRVIASEGKMHRVLENGRRLCCDASGFYGFSGSGIFDSERRIVGIVITSRGDHPSPSSATGTSELFIHTQAEGPASIAELMKTSEDLSLMTSSENLPELRNRGKYWNSKEMEDIRKLSMAKSLMTGSAEEKSAAARILSAMAESGNAEAQATLGICYEQGMAGPADFAKAAELFLRAAHQGHSCAKHHLGLLYLNGQGVPQDDGQALVWLEQAAKDPPACGKLFLGIYYHKKKDLVQALHWYRLAQQQGDARAEEYLTQIRSLKAEASP